METKAAITPTADDWMEYPDTAAMSEGGFLSNESSTGIGLWFQVTSSKPTDNTGHSIPVEGWVMLPITAGTKVWVKAKRNPRAGEYCEARITA